MLTLYLMQGPSGSGKTAFLHRWHLDNLVVSPDAMRDMLTLPMAKAMGFSVLRAPCGGGA